MLVFKILVIVCLVFCIVILVLNVHNAVQANKMIGSVQNWAVEIDKSNLAYIKQQFAKLKIENNLVINDDEDEQGNDFAFTENDEEKQ